MRGGSSRPDYSNGYQNPVVVDHSASYSAPTQTYGADLSGASGNVVDNAGFNFDTMFGGLSGHNQDPVVPDFPSHNTSVPSVSHDSFSAP